ncbi:mRNA turnover protein 4 homolog [Liolophura sinensis]|uniref:mRNA turnover protein 4 homolog n=1 Tax=Liolophura sinensis TaxID=3198878 RepID=UPI003158D12B
MPKSKRDKKVSLTQTRKKGLEWKQTFIEEIRDCCDKYARIFTFSVQNMRNVQLKTVRQEWRHSRFFFGKNKVMSLALGRSPQEEYRESLHQISRQLKGQTGLLFTNTTKEDVLKYFDSYRCLDFARSGNKATQTVVLEEGPIPEFSHSMEPQLRQLGLPTSLKRGVITLLREHQVCEEGDILTPEQARILKLFGYEMAEFHLTLEGMWTNNGTWEVFTARPEPLRPTKVRVKAKPRESGDDVMQVEPSGGSDGEEGIEDEDEDT